MFLDFKSFSIVLDLNISGEIYNNEAFPLETLSMASALSIGFNMPLIVTASSIPLATKLST